VNIRQRRDCEVSRRTYGTLCPYRSFTTFHLDMHELHVLRFRIIRVNLLARVTGDMVRQGTGPLGIDVRNPLREFRGTNVSRVRLESGRLCWSLERAHELR
jgi:hypothetical protein